MTLTMSIILSVVEAIFIFVALVAAYRLLDDVDVPDEDEPKEGQEYVIAGCIGLATGVINVVAPLLEGNGSYVTPIMLLCMVAVYAYLAYLWHERGAEGKELIPFVVLMIPLFWTTSQVCWGLSAIVMNNFLASAVQTLPHWLTTLTLGYIVFDFFHYRYSEDDLYNTGKGTKANAERYHLRGRHMAGMIATAVVVAIMLFGSSVSGLDFSKSSADAGEGLDTSVLDGVYAASGDDIGSVTLDTWDGIHFYHNDVLNDGNDDNDWNNGPKAKGKDELIERLGKDPALDAQLMLAYDYEVGTNFVGEVIYADYNDKWTVLDQVDAATRIMASKKNVFDAGNNALVKMINGASKVEREKRTVSDQVFMHSNTIDGIPSTVVFESNVKEAWCLVLYYNFKDGSPAAEIVLREACGYQWCNGAADIGVTPKAYPSTGSPKKSSKPGKDKVSKPKKPSGTGDGPSPSGPSYNKDPNKAPSKDTEPNDDKGPGPNTNNPKDPNHSTEDKPSNSDHMTYDQYKEKVQTNKDANDSKPSGGSSGGSSSGSSSSGGSSGGSHRDDNSSSGTGHGGVDKPTPTSKPATSGGKEVTGSGDSWEGPSD